jgi:hypothetical protein
LGCSLYCADQDKRCIKRQSRSSRECIFLQFTHTIFDKVAELLGNLLGHGIARWRLFESGQLEIEVTETMPLFCLIRVTHCAIWAEVKEE